MVTPRDWVPPYAPGDERNDQHRKDYDFHAAVYPNSPAWERQNYADAKLAAREAGTGQHQPPEDTRITYIRSQHAKAQMVGNGITPPPPSWEQVGVLLDALLRVESKERHARGCFNDLPAAVDCQVCGATFRGPELGASPGSVFAVEREK